MNRTSRRQFLRAASAVAVASAIAPRLTMAQDAPKLKKAVKFGMIKQGATIKDKFALIKSLGFDGVEMDSPSDINRDEAKSAAAETGIVIHGVIDSVHWKDRLSNPDAATRERGLAALRTAIDDAAFYGATTVLLVPGKVSDKPEDDESFEKVWSRSQDEIRKVIPQAREKNVKIGIEVVWNNFITKPEQLIKYVDEFNDPTIGAYFDVSNMIKYGVAPADWIRALGPRMLKFDFKGYSNEKQWVPIGEGDEDWPAVLKALKEIGYEGWATSEVSGGGEAELRDVAERMNRVLGIG